MKRLILVFFLFSGLSAKSQCDTLTSATFTAITTNSVNVSFFVSGGNWSSFNVSLYDSATGFVAFNIPNLTTIFFTATGLTPNKTYILRVFTSLAFGGGCEPNGTLPKFRTLGNPLGYTPMLANGYSYKRISVDSTFHLPLQDTSLNRGLLRAGAIVQRTQDSSLYAWNGLKWDAYAKKAYVDTKPSYGDVRDIVSDSILGKVNKWERWADTLYVQPNDSAKTALTLRSVMAGQTAPLIAFKNSGDTTVFEMRSPPNYYGARNLAIGMGSGKNIRPIQYNSGIYGNIIGGGGNTFIGDSTGSSLIDGNENTGVGNYALKSLIGANGGDPNFISSLNTAIGSTSLEFLSTGTSNSAIGQKSGWQITTGNQNTVFGKSSGERLTTENGNNFMGVQSGKYALASNYSLKIGNSSGLYQGGGYNISLGTNSASDTLYYSGGPMYVQNTFIAGGSDSLAGIYDVYFGNGAFSRTNARAYKIRGTNGYGTNINGGDINFVGGFASGIGNAGSLRFITGQSIASGTQQQFDVERMRVNGANGFIGINDNSPSEMLSINGGAGMGLTYGKVKFAMSQINPQIKFYNIFGTNYYPWYLSTGRGTRGRAFSIMNGAATAVGSETMSDALTIDTLGIIGIGTANPIGTSKVEIVNSSSAAIKTALRLSNPFDNTNTGVSLEFLTASSFLGGSITSFRESQGGPQHSMRFDVGGARMLHVENGFFGSHIRLQATKVGIGTTSDATTLAALHVISSTLNQQRTGFDGSNYYTTAVSSTGSVTFNAVGTGQKFNYSDTINATAIQRIGGTSSQILAADGSVIVAGSGVSINSGVISATTSVFGGTISATVTSATTFVVTIPTQANNTYQISVQGGNMASTGGWVTNKTTTSFDYVVPTAITGTVTFDWILKP